MSQLEKFKVILKHYIEHSKEHTDKYLEWSEKLKTEDEEISRLLQKAVEKFREGENILEEIYRKISSKE